VRGRQFGRSGAARAALLAAVVAGAMAGLVAGAVAMARIQDAGSADPRSVPGVTAPPAPPTVPVPSAPAVLLAWTSGGLDPGLPAAAAADPEVTAASVVAAGTVDLVASYGADGAVVDAPAAGWAIPLEAAAIDPATHTAFVGGPDLVAVAGLGPGQALLGTTSAQLRRLGPGGRLTLAGGTTVTVVGVVGDTAIGGAELAVDRATGAALGVSSDRYVLLAHRGDRPGLEQRLRAAVAPDRPVRFRGTGETPFLRHGDAVLPQVLIKQRFGEFAYRPAPGDAFEQDPAWQEENLVTVDLPIIGTARCHRLVVGALDGALREVVDANLASLVDPAGFAGCWNPRTTRSGTGISRHAWGVAIDLNAGSNPTDLASVQDPRLVAVFARWGFTEGSRWLVPDAGHFEYVSPPEN
jgi:D-alanyl-D-alanine carboxypeptidase